MKKTFERRDFLKLCASGTCGAAIHNILRPANSFMAFAAPPAPAVLGPNSVFILVNLAGGCSYNICPPYLSQYIDRNPNVGFTPEESLPLTAEQGLHPSLTGLRNIYNEGNLALINMVGYPNPNRSHDESTEIWFRGMRSAGGGAGGWAARLTCQLGSSFAGVSLEGSNTLIDGDCNPPRSLGDLRNLGEDNFWGGGDGTKWLQLTRTQAMLEGAAPVHSTHSFVKESIVNFQTNIDLIRSQTAVNLPGFPNTGFGQTCHDAAKLVLAPALGTRFIFLDIGGFDTHADERPRLTQLLNELNGGLSALITALKNAGRWQNTIIATMSEFCRTFENSSQGTDHGHAAPLLVMGGGVNGGIKSPPPTAADMVNGSYFHNYHVHFAQVFSDVVSAMGLSAGTVFPEAYPPSTLNLFS